ncbi:DUF2958 domain-containing protein [Acidithiobacillus ferrooxidans]|uniref:DUF2958 domain-containing protein n=1 Tax=Acidithiobacillus ferrooxidans TaxID=920 RepID=UPI0021482C8B|nr:SNF2-related protein [Acidithiobacillus ferrooxidans]MCR1347567.1 DUF2958 domain-containing protein [Acidithiobacillus ferrooxidans]MCR1355725.1 DUF2958 domain-containing protein [Acidithiobacillus ferrooxidans]
MEEGGAEDLPPLPKDPLADVPLAGFFDLNFDHSVNHRRGVDGSDQRGQKQKARDNLQAIRILKTCVAENRAPSPEEQQKIALFYGFGGLPYSFRRPNGNIESGWSDVVLELEALTTEEELKSLRARTVDAQYTSDAVVSAIWDTVRQALPEVLPNWQEPLKVLEPSVGSGVFLSLAPADVPMEFLAVEMDPITATVAKALHPKEEIYNAPFQKVQFSETVDVVVGNPPFGKGKLLDMKRPDLTQVSPNTHGYFFAKSLDVLRPGGLAVLVVSRYLLDADMPEHRAFRVWLHNQAELVSAVRLPHTVFSKTAFTDVVCDVVALRKREHPLNVIYEPPTRKTVEDWTKARKKEIWEREERKAAPEDLIYPLPDDLPEWILGKAVIAMGPDEKGQYNDVPVLGNPWYRTHPDHVLGELSIGWGKGLYRKGAPIVLPLPEFEDIGASLARVLQADVQPGLLEGLDRSQRIVTPEYPVLTVEDMGPRATPYSFFVVPEPVRKAALDTWKQIHTGTTDPLQGANPDGRIPAPVASRLFTTEDQPLIGMRLPDWMNYRTQEKNTSWKLVTFAPSKAANDIQRLIGMIGLRNTLLDLLDLQRTEERRQTPEMQALRRKLRQDYDRFVKRHHHLRRPVNESLMRDDPSWAMLSGLEIEYTPEVSLDKSRRLGIPRSPEQVVLSEIFERRTQYPIQRVEHVDSAVDAMMVSLSESGQVDPARLQSLTGKSLTAIHKELKIGQEDALAFIAPDGHWEERSQWLSGNIDEKIRMLQASQAQSNSSDAWNRDIAILEAHRPPRISILDRTIHIGAFWLPQAVVSDFVTHLGGIQPMVHKNLITGEWSVKCDGHPPEYSTDDLSLQDLLMALHNRRTIQVTYQKDNKTVVDAEATSLAVEKGDRIKDAWRDWIYADTDRVRRLEDHYNDLMNTYRPRDYDGRHLNLPGSNPEIRLRPHQKNAVWRMMQSKSTLLDHVVGAGKTFAAIAGVMEKRRTGQSQKPLIAVPNHLVGQWTKDWLRLYPDARLLVADKEDMTGSHRQVFLAKAAFNDVDAVIVAHSSFDRIPIDAEFYEQYLTREMDQAEDFLRSKISMEGLSVKRMEKKIQEVRTRVERLHSQANESRDQGCLNFSEIGFDLLVVDESHNYKNVPYNTTLQNVRGLGNPVGSIKAENMMIKVTQCRDVGSGVVFLTGTPISNTVAEMYLLQKYMAPEKLEEKGIHTFDAWVSLFAEVQEEFAFTLTGGFKNLRTLSTFDNLPELVGMYRDYADVINQKDIAQLLKEQRQHAIPMPKIKGGKAEIVVCPMTPAQRRIIGEEVGYREDTGEPEYAEGSILWRLDHLPTRPGPGEDNVLVIISDLRKAGLDARAFDPSYVPEEGEETGKLGICAENVKRIYDEWNEDRGTQLVYLDFSTPGKRNRQEQNALEKQLAKIVAGESPDATDKEKQDAESALEKLLEKYTSDEIQEARAQWLGGENTPASFVAYEALRNRMVALGIPREEIAFIHDADTDEKKEELFDAVRAGKVRVMIGSTPKMGPGMNVQDRLVHVHHLDAPYRPTDVEQRNGRIIRQGNLLLKKYGKSFRVGISYYVTENSSDAGLWQILETKKKFIDQVRYYDGKSSSVSDPDAQALDPAAIKAQASGHEVLMLEVPLRARVKRLTSLKNGYREEMSRARIRAETAREKLAELHAFAMPRSTEVAAQIRALQETLKTGGSPADGSPADANPVDLLSIDKKEDPAFIPWGQGGHERLVTKKFLMDKFNKAMRELNGQTVSAHERVGFIGGFVVELEQLFTAGAMTIKVYPPDAKHTPALHISSTKFDPEKNVNFFSRLENMLDASALETSIRNKEREYQSAIRLGESSQVFGQEEELQTLQQQHQLASRLLRLKVRKLDGLEERLTSLFLQDMKKTPQEVQETNPNTGETITVSKPMHSKEQERDAHHQAKTFVQEMIDAFSRPPLTENALSVLEKLGVSAKRREALRENLGLSAEDAGSPVEAEDAENEDEEVVEEQALPETAVDETVLKSRIGIREQVEAENPWLSASAPFLPDLSAPGNGIQVSLFDDLFASETPVQAESPSPSHNPPVAPSVLQPANLQTAEMLPVETHHAEIPSAEMPSAGVPSGGTPSAGAEAIEAKEIQPEVIMENAKDTPHRSMISEIAPLRQIPESILPFLSQSQRMATEQGLRGDEREYFSDKMRELEQVIANMPQTYQTDGQGDNAPVTLHYFRGNADWYIIEKDRDPDKEGQIQAFGLADLGMGEPELGYINIRELVQAGVEMDYHFAPRTLRELKLEKYPELVQDSTSEIAPAPTMEPVPANQWQAIQYQHDDDRLYVDETRPPFDGKPVLIGTPDGIAEAVWKPASTKYTAEGAETNGFYWSHATDDLDLDEVRAWHPLPNAKSVHPVHDLDGLAYYREKNPILIQTKKQGWVEAWFDDEYQNWQALDTQIITLDPEDFTGWTILPKIPAGLQPQTQTLFYSFDQAPGKSGETVEQMLKNWSDSGIATDVDDHVMARYRKMPVNTASLRVLYTRKPQGPLLSAAAWGTVEYKEPVILAQLPDHAVLVAEQSYLDAYRNALSPEQYMQENILVTLASWMTAGQRESLRNILNDGRDGDLPHTLSQLNTIANWLRNPTSGPGNRSVPLPRVAEIQAGAGLNVLTYRSPDSLQRWFITGMDPFSGALYGLQMVRSRPDGRWEAQMGPVSRQELLDAGFLLELIPAETFVVADRMREMAPYISGVDALPAEPPRAATPSAAPDLKVGEQTMFDSGIPASGHTIGDLLSNLRENGVNMIAPSDVINQYFYMERGESVRMVYSDPVGKNSEPPAGVQPLHYHDPVTLAVGPDNLILVAERAELDAYLAQNPQQSAALASHPASTLDIPERLKALATPEQQSEWRALADDDDESRELLQVQLNRLDLDIKNLPTVDTAERLRLDGRAGLILRSENQDEQWFITGRNADETAYGLHIHGEQATVGRVDLRVALLEAPILITDHEAGPIRADLRDGAILIESVEYEDDPRAIFWRGGQNGTLPLVQRIEDILDYERNTLENEDVRVNTNAMEYLHLPPVRTLQWVTTTEAAAREYGDPQMAIFTDPVVLARDDHGGVLVAEREMLDAAMNHGAISPEMEGQQEHSLIPATVARFMGDAQKELLTTLLNGTDQNTTVMLSPDDIRTQLERLDRWANTASTMTMEDAQANELDATGHMALRNMRNGDLIFVSALSEDGASGYGLVLHPETHQGEIRNLDFSEVGTDAWTVVLAHRPKSLRATLDVHGYAPEQITHHAITPENPKAEKAGLTELAQEGPTYQSAVEAIESAGGWDAVADSPALQKSLQDQLDHLIQMRAEQVSQVLREGGWKWSGAAFSRPDAENGMGLHPGMGFKIFPNGRSSGENMVHWGYRITRRDGDTPTAIDIDDDMTLDAQGLVASMLDQMENPQAAVTSAQPTPEAEPTPAFSEDVQKNLNTLRPFVSEHQFNAIQAVLAGESGLEAAKSEAQWLAQKAQWISQKALTYPGGRIANGGHLAPDDAAVQGVAANCVLAYQNQSGTRKTYLTGMDDLGNLYGIRIRTRAIAGPVSLANILNQGDTLNLTMQPTPVAELLKEDGYLPEGVSSEPAVTAIHEPYRDAIARTLPAEQVQFVLNLAVSAMSDDWTGSARKIQMVERALRTIPDETLRLATLENLKTAADAVEQNRHAEAVRAGLANDPVPEAPQISATPLQQAMLGKIARSPYIAINGVEPKHSGDTQTWAMDIIKTIEDKNVFASLLNAGLVWHSVVGQYAAVGLTDNGFALYQSFVNDQEPSLFGLPLGTSVEQFAADVQKVVEKVRANTAVTTVEKPNASKPWLVGLTGKPGAGKDTVADLLIAQSGHAIKIGFGDILYQEVSGAYGIPVEWLENRKMKDSPQSALSRSMCQNQDMQEVLKNKDYTAPLSPRYVLQQWGDFRRAQNPDYLIHHVREQVQMALDSGSLVAVSGMRTMPELALIQAMGGVTLRVRNPEVDQVLARVQSMGSAEANHPLENTLDDVPMNLEIVNDGTLENLQAKIPELYAHIQTFKTGPLSAPPAATLQESIIIALQDVPGLTMEPSPHATEVLVTDSRSQHVYSITQQNEDFRVHVKEAEKEDYEDRFATLDDAMDFVRHEIFTAQEANIDESSPYYQALLNTLPGMPEAERNKMFLAVTGVMPDDWTGTLIKRRVVSRVANAYAAHFPASVTIDQVMERLVAASTRVNGLDLADTPLSPAAVSLPDAGLPSAGLPGAALPAARPFGTLDPIASVMLKKIEDYPYSLPYLLGDDRARDVDDPPYEEDAGWQAARVQFADEIDAVLNARIRQNVDALGERGWMQPILHGDLTRGGAVIRLDAMLNADGDMQGLAYRVSLAADMEGRETRTVRDYLRGSSTQFANELHGIAEQIKQKFNQREQNGSQKTLDDYVVAHIREHAPIVAQQAKANALEHFLLGNVLSAVSNAILDAIEDKSLPQSMRDAAKAVLQGREGMTDYRARIGQRIFDAENAAPAVLEGELLPAGEQKSEHLQNAENLVGRIAQREQRERQIALNQEVWSVVEIPLGRPVPIDAWLPMTDAQLGFRYRTENGVCELVFGTSRGDEVILSLNQDRVLFFDPTRNLQDPAMQRVILPLLADQLPEWETALQDAGVSLRGITLPTDSDIAEWLAIWKQMAGNAPTSVPVTLPEAALPEKTPDPQYPVTILDGIGDTAAGAMTGFSADGKQLWLTQKDGAIVAVEHADITDWRMVGLFHGNDPDASDNDEALAIHSMLETHAEIALKIERNEGLIAGPVPLLALYQDNKFLSSALVSRLHHIHEDWKAIEAAFDGLTEHYANDPQVTVMLNHRCASLSENRAKITMRYDLPDNGNTNISASIKFATDWKDRPEDKINVLIDSIFKPYSELWSSSHAIKDRNDLPGLIAQAESLRDEAVRQRDALQKQEPLVQAYLDSYALAAEHIQAAMNNVDKSLVTDESSARDVYRAVDKAVREGQGIIETAADALRKVSENGQISMRVNDRLGRYAPAQQHREVLMAVRALETELMELAKNHLMQKGRDFLAAADESTPIEEIAVAIFHKHGHSPTKTPDMVKYVQDRDLRRIQSAIGHNSMNPASQEIFERMTGVQLGKTQKVRVRQIDAWANITPEMRERMDAEEKNQREKRQNTKELQSAWESFAGMRMQRGGTGQDYVLAMIGEGYTQVSSYKKGASVQYGLLNPETHEVRYMTRSPEFTRFCKAVLRMNAEGVVLDALQKAELMDMPQPTVPEPASEPVTGQDEEMEHLFSVEGANSAATGLPDPVPATDHPLPGAALPGAALQAAALPGATLSAASLLAASPPSAGLPEQTPSDLLPDPEEEDIAEDEDDEEDPDFAPVSAAEKSELPGWKVSRPDMLSPLWDMQILSTWPNEHGVFLPAYHADWSHGKGYFEKVGIDIARDPQGRYRFSTHTGGSGYLPGVNSPAFATFLEAHTSAREELAENLRNRYAESTAERGFINAAPKLLECVTQRADGNHHTLAKADDLLREPPYQEAFGEIMERLEGNQRLILAWGYRNERPVNPWMVTLHHAAEEQAVVAELRPYGQWDFTQSPEFAHVVDPSDMDAWTNFIRQVADRFPEKDRDALFSAPYGLHQEPVWHLPEPLPAQQVPDQPPAPRWPEDMDHDDLPVEAPGALKNFDRFVGLRFGDGKQYVALFIGRDKQGYVPAIGFRNKGISGPSVPNARDTHYPSFAEAYARGRKILGKHLKEHDGPDWTTDADRAAKDWLNKKPGAADPITFGYDAARMETVWDRQDLLQGVEALQISHKKAFSITGADEMDRYRLEAVIAGENRTRYLSTVHSLDRALLLVNSTFALMQDLSGPAQKQDTILETPESLQRAETIVSHLKEEFGDLLTVAPEGKSPLQGGPADGKNPLQESSPLLQQVEQLAADIQRKEAQAAGPSPTLGEIMAHKLSDMVAAKRLKEMFGSDEALGVRFVDHQGNEISMTMDADVQSVFPDGTSAITCTNYAEQIKKALPGYEVQIVGFENEKNPDCAVAREDWHADGHDFAIVDHRWLVDPWARLVASVRDQIVYDLRDPDDAQKVADTYGDPLKWALSGTSSIGHESTLDLWDRTGLEGVNEAIEVSERKAAGITITEAAIIPTRSGVIAVPTDPNLPIYRAGESSTANTAETWLSGIPEAYRESVHSVLAPFTALPAKVKDATLTAARTGHRMLNADLEGPEWWRNGQILLHAKIEDATREVVEREWSLSWSRESVNNGQLYAMFTQIRDHKLLDSLRSVDRVTADHGHVIVSGILGRNEIAEIMACQGLQPLRLLLTVEPDGLPGETLDRLTSHLVDRLRGWRMDFPDTPVVIDILTLQGFPETVMNQLRAVAESVRRVDTTDPEAAVRRADLTAQIGAPCDWVAPILGHNFRSQQKRDLVKPLLVYQPDLLEVRLEKLLPEVLSALHQRNETNHRQAELRGLTPLAGVQPLSRTRDTIDLQTPDEQAQPQKVEASAQTEDPRQIQAGLLHDMAEPASPAALPSAGQDADWQRLKDLRVTLPEIMDASQDQRPLLDHLVKRGIPLSLFQEPSSVNCVAAVLESGELAGVGAQAWAVRRSDLVAQDADLRELRFYNGDPEQRHVFLLVGNRFLFDPWMAMSKPGVPYALDIQNPADRDALIDRYLSPAFWISPHPAAVLSPAWQELERWNPDLQAFTDANDDEAEIPMGLRETIQAPAETILPLPETLTALPETIATKPEKTPEAPIPTRTPADSNPENPDASCLAGGSLSATDDPAGSIPAVGDHAGSNPLPSAGPGSSTAAPREQEVIMDWKSLSQTPEILPELAAYLQGLAEHPERLPETGRFWAQSVPQEVLREMLVSLSAEWGRDYWKLTVDFLVNSLNSDPLAGRADLQQHGPAKNAITGLAFLLMHLSATEALRPGQDVSVLDRAAFLQLLESLPAASQPQTQGAPQVTASTPAQVRGEIGPDDRIVEIRVIPLDAAEQDWNIQDGAKQDWKVQGGQEPARWKLVAILQDGWEIPKVLKAGVTYAQALQAARDRVEKWGAQLVDVYADARAGIVQNKPADDLRLERGEFTDTPAGGNPAGGIPAIVAPAWSSSPADGSSAGSHPAGAQPPAGTQVPDGWNTPAGSTPAGSIPAVNSPAPGASWPASVPPSSWPSPKTAVTPSGTNPLPDTGLQTVALQPAGQLPSAGLTSAGLTSARPGEKPGFDIPQSIWKQEVTHPMNAEEQRAMEQVNAFLKDSTNIDEATKRQWIGQAIVVRDKTLEMMQPYFRRDPVLAAQWQQSDLLLDMVRKTMTVNRENIQEILLSPGNGAKRMLLQHLPTEPTIDTIRGWVLENAMMQMVMQTMNMDPFRSMMQIISNRTFAFPHHALVDLSPPLVLFGPDRSARIILMRTPRSIPHVDSKDAIAQMHACKSWVDSILKEEFKNEHLSIRMHIAYFDAARQNVLIRDVTEIPGQADAARKQAETVAGMVENKQIPHELPRIVSKVDLTPEITRDVQEIARLEAMRQTLDTQIQKMEQDLQSRMGGDPEGWPKIPQEVSMGSIRTEWSSRILEDKALNALSTLGIPRSQVEKPEYDLDGMLRALNAAGIAPGQFITGHQMDTERLNAVLQAYGVPRAAYQPARPVVTPSEKHPAYQHAAQTLQAKLQNSSVPTEEFTP